MLLSLCLSMQTRTTPKRTSTAPSVLGPGGWTAGTVSALLSKGGLKNLRGRGPVSSTGTVLGAH